MKKLLAVLAAFSLLFFSFSASAGSGGAEVEFNGKTYHLENENGTRHLEEIELGKSVDIMYDPDNPTHFHMTSDDANETGSNSLIRFGIIIIIGAAILAVTNHYYHFL